MASFKQHIQFSGLISCVLISILLVKGISISVAIVVGFWCWLGGMLPDIDSDTSKPLDLIFIQLGCCVPILVIAQFPETVALSTITIVYVAGVFLVQYPIRKAFEICTMHRGAYHSIPTAICVAAIVVFAYRKEGSGAWLFGLGVFLGYLSHLVLDEVFSIDIYRLKIKKSFGTAFKFSAGGFLKTIFLYIFGAGLLFLVHKEQPLMFFNKTQTIDCDETR